MSATISQEEKSGGEKGENETKKSCMFRSPLATIHASGGRDSSTPTRHPEQAAPSDVRFKNRKEIRYQAGNTADAPLLQLSVIGYVAGS